MPEPAQSNGRSAERDARQAVMEAARQEFAARRFARASLNRIIRHSGTSKGTVYYYFEGKEHLYAEVLAEVHGLLMDAWRHEDLSSLNRQTFWATVRRQAAAAADVFRKRPDLVPLFRNFHDDYRSLPETRVTRDLYEVSRRALQGYLARGRELGLVREDLPLERIVALAEAVDPIVDDWFLEDYEARGYDAAIAVHLDLVIDILRRLSMPQRRQLGSGNRR